MKIRKARECDLEQIMAIYAHARGFMAQTGNPNQWGPTNWPPAELVQNDIACGKSYVCVLDDADASGTGESEASSGLEAPRGPDVYHEPEAPRRPIGAQSDVATQGAERKAHHRLDDDAIVGVFYFDFGSDIEPTYRRIVDGNWADNSPYGVVHRIASSGTAKGVGAACINWAFEQCGHMRIDTHGDNVVMQHLLEKLGFERRGTIYVEEDNYPRLAYEKTSEKSPGGK